MQTRICIDEDIVSLLHCASDDKDIYKLGMFDNWAQYQKWLLDCVYSKSYQVLVAVEEWGVIGFLVWDLYQVYYKWLAYLHYIYVGEDFRKSDVSDKLVLEFIHNLYSSSAQRMKFDSRVLPAKWIEAISSNAPLSKYDTYYIERTEEAKEFYLTQIKPLIEDK